MSPEKPSQPSTSPPDTHQSKMIEVDVDVAGIKHRVYLSSKDISSAGFFLRTVQPAPLWKKVRLRLSRPDGGQIEISGEIVRSVAKEKATGGQPTGMAVAFDESSRAKYKEFAAFVQSLSATPPPAATPTPAKASPKPFIQTPVTQPGVKPAPLFKATPATDPATRLTPRPVQPSPPQLRPPAPVRSDAVKPLPSSPALAPSVQNPADIKQFLDDYKSKHTGVTYYDTLGLGLQATPQEIESAYHHLIGMFNITDSHASLPQELIEELAAIVNKVRKAHAILSKPDRKRAYDFIIDNAG